MRVSVILVYLPGEEGMMVGCGAFLSGECPAAQMNAGMKRALEAFQEAILMVDTSKDSWTVLHVNSAFSHQTGEHLPVFMFAVDVQC